MFLALILLWQADRAGWVGPTRETTKDRDPDLADARVPRSDQVVAEGRLVTYPGAEVVIGTEIMGTIVAMPVREKSVVHRGDLIAELRSDELKASLAEAEARIVEAEADIRYFELEVHRAERLQARKVGTQVEVDGNRRDLEVAHARRTAAAAAKRRFEALIAKTRILAPIDGMVTARHAQPWETVEAAGRLVTIADLNQVRIEAEVGEFDVGKIALGADVIVTAVGYPDTRWRGTVEEIPDTVVGRRIRPEDSGRLTDTRVLLVKIALKEKTPLKLGQLVEVFLSR